MRKWTIKELKETDDLTFAMVILSDRREGLNQEAPLAKKVRSAYHTLEQHRDAARNCIDCEFMDCAYNDGSGQCRYVLVKGKAPEITEEDGCVVSVYDIVDQDADVSPQECAKQPCDTCRHNLAPDKATGLDCECACMGVTEFDSENEVTVACEDYEKEV